MATALRQQLDDAYGVRYIVQGTVQAVLRRML
jgi:hypothetical protein